MGRGLGPAQGARARFSGLAGAEHDVLLRVQGASFPTSHLEVRYDHAARLVRVATYTSGTGWQNRAQWSRTFVAGDTLGAEVDSAGTVQAYHNATLVGSVSIASWTYATSGGYVGLTLADPGARADVMWAGALTPPAPPVKPGPKHWLTFTLRPRNSLPNCGGSGPDPELAMRDVTVYGSRDSLSWECMYRMSLRPWLAYDTLATGVVMPRDTVVTIPTFLGLDSTMVYRRATLRDCAGNESCPSGEVRVLW